MQIQFYICCLLLISNVVCILSVVTNTVEPKQELHVVFTFHFICRLTLAAMHHNGNRQQQTKMITFPEHKKGDNTSKKVKTPYTYGKTLYSFCIF